MQRMCGLGLCLVGCSGGGGETIDMVSGTYEANLAQDAIITPDVTLKDPKHSWLFVRFYDPDPGDGTDELWADVTLDAQILVYGLEVDEESPTIQGVTVDDFQLECQLELQLVTLGVTGEFSHDMQELHLNVERVGEVWMDLQTEGADE